MTSLAFLCAGVGGAALLARTGYRAAVRHGVEIPKFSMPVMNLSALKGLEGFEQPMTRKEAQRILNLSPMLSGKDQIRA